MDKNLKASGSEQTTAACYRKPFTTNDVDADADADVDVSMDSKAYPKKARRRPPIQSESPGVTTQLMEGLFRMLGPMVTVLVPFLPKILLCYFLFNISRTAVDSACKSPVASFIPYCQSQGGGDVKFDALVSLQSRLIDVQELGVSGKTLPMQLEYSKNVVREVASIVRHSNIPSRSDKELRDKVFGHLTEFWQRTDSTGDEIGDFLQGIDRMIDSVITQNDITLRNLKHIALSNKQPPSVGSQVLATLFHRPVGVTDKVRRQYIQHLDKLTVKIDTLIVNSQLLEENLKQLADIQWGIHDLIEGDSQEVSHQERAVQSSFWAWFGGYRDLLEDYKQQAAVLHGLDKQRVWAVDLVSEISQTLKALKKRLSDLRIRIQEPGFDIDGDLESQIAVIQKGVDALTMGRAKAKTEKQKTMADIKRQIDARRSEI